MNMISSAMWMPTLLANETATGSQTMKTLDPCAVLPKERKALVTSELARNPLCSIIIALTLALQGCITPPKLDQPQQEIANERLGLAAQVFTPIAAQAWWSAFNDPQLDRLMQQALADNPNLTQAMARVREAQSLADAARASLAPSLSFNAQETRQRFSGHDVIPPPYAGTKRWEGHEGLNLSWDIDFWGRQDSLLKQARSRTTAAALDVASARLALSGAVARAYIDLFRNDQLADVAQRTEAQRERILEITRRRVLSGLDTNVELREASGAVPEAHVELLEAQTAAAVDTHQLAALSGQGAVIYAQVRRPTLDPAAILPLPEALPADLLGHRPDVLAARDRIEAARAGQAAAKAAFYPDINLAAFAGTTAVGFDNLFHGSSGAYGAGPAIHLPLFDAGRLRAEYRGAAAEIDDSVSAYNQSVLQAVRETSDQLSLIEALNAQIVLQERSLDDAETAYNLAEERYRAGLSSYLTVLNTESAVLSARREHVDLVSGGAIARVSLLLAVGGSFDPGEQHE
jgi:NodT family efflux transporter outer membrane factor (OMF) lipoprotein